MDDDEDEWDAVDDEPDADPARFSLLDAEDDEEAEPEPGDFWLDRSDETDD